MSGGFLSVCRLMRGKLEGEEQTESEVRKKKCFSPSQSLPMNSRKPSTTKSTQTVYSWVVAICLNLKMATTKREATTFWLPPGGTILHKPCLLHVSIWDMYHSNKCIPLKIVLLLFDDKNVVWRHSTGRAGTSDSTAPLHHHNFADPGIKWCHQHKMAAPVSCVFWPHFCTVIENGRFLVLIHFLLKVVLHHWSSHHMWMDRFL